MLQDWKSCAFWLAPSYALRGQDNVIVKKCDDMNGGRVDGCSPVDEKNDLLRVGGRIAVSGRAYEHIKEVMVCRFPEEDKANFKMSSHVFFCLWRGSAKCVAKVYWLSTVCLSCFRGFLSRGRPDIAWIITLLI